MKREVDLKEFVAGFVAESDEHMRVVNASLMQLDAAAKKGAPNPRAVRELFRALHTMKGLAGMVGVEPIVDIAHAMESVLRLAEKSGGRLVSHATGPLVDGAQGIASRLRALAAGQVVPAAPAQLLEALGTVNVDQAGPSTPPPLSLDADLLARISASEREQLALASAQGKRAYTVIFTPSVEGTASGVNITAVRQRIGELAEIVKVLPIAQRVSGTSSQLRFALLVVSSAGASALAEAGACGVQDVSLIEVQAPASEPAIGPELPEEEQAVTSGFLRVDVGRVDDAMDRLGALLVNRFRLGHAIDALAAKGADVRELREIAQDARKRLLDMRAAVVGLRMVSVATLLEPLPLLVRGLSAATRKPVELLREAGSVELDKAVAESLWPAIVHLVRNAIDHGIESPDTRLQAGKPAHGTIRIACRERSGSRVEISVEDDGRGVDRNQVAARAGVAPPADDAALLELLTRPGFSTRDQADATSGRGMGMDIVKRTIAGRLRGELRIRTIVGVGTNFTIEVPVTLSVVDTLRFESLGRSFLVPVAMVEELVEVEQERVSQAPAPHLGGANVALLERRGHAIPLMDLSAMLGAPRAPSCRKAIVVRSNDALFAFGVDRMLGQHEVVVRPLRDPLVQVPGVAGATDLGDGTPTLVLDLVALTRGFAERAAEVA